MIHSTFARIRCICILLLCASVSSHAEIPAAFGGSDILQLYPRFAEQDCLTRESGTDRAMVEFEAGDTKDFRSSCDMSSESELTLRSDGSAVIRVKDKSHTGRSLTLRSGTAGSRVELALEWLKVKRDAVYDYHIHIKDLTADSDSWFALAGTGPLEIILERTGASFSYGDNRAAFPLQLKDAPTVPSIALVSWRSSDLLGGDMVELLKSPRAAEGMTLELGQDRAGSDLERIAMEDGQHNQCADLCADNPFCRAYTWVEPGIQEDLGVCYLKHASGSVTSDECCTSGRRLTTPRFEGTREERTDLPGSDFMSQVLPQPDPQLCEAACAASDQCSAYTYVQPGVQNTGAVCYLKSAVPDRITGSDCCISGIKQSAMTYSFVRENQILHGADSEDFQISGGYDACHRICLNDPGCKAVTYRATSTDGSIGHCWLKDRLSFEAEDNADFQSGFKHQPSRAMDTPMFDIDMPGDDYQTLLLTRDDYQLCRDACGADALCRSYTFVRPQFTASRQPQCWLKNKGSWVSSGLDPQLSKDRVASECCVSGNKLRDFYEQQYDPNGSRLPLQFSSTTGHGHSIIEGLAMPADMPPVRIPPVERCSASQAREVRQGWVMAHHHLWRARQVLNYLDSMEHDRQNLWNYGFVDQVKINGDWANFTPRGWFGGYSGKHFRQVKRALDKLWRERYAGSFFTLRCDDTDGSFHARVGFMHLGDNFLGDEGVHWKARVMVHESMHWLKIPRTVWWLTDNHDAWGRGGCNDYSGSQTRYLEKAANLALIRGCRSGNWNRAVRNVDNYTLFATTLGQRIYDGRIRQFPGRDFTFSSDR